MENIYGVTQLAISSGQLSVFLDLLPIGAVAIDPNSHVILCANRVALEMIGSDSGVILGKICHDFICPCARNQCPISDFKQEVDNSERVLLTLKGEKVPILKTVKTITLDQREILLETFVDVSRVFKSEKDLALMKFACDNAREFIVCVDSNGRYIYANNSTSNLLGYPEIAGKYMWEVNEASLDVDRWPKFWEQIKSQNNLTFQTELTANNKCKIPFEVTGQLLQIGGNEYFWAFGRDITESLKAEEQRVCRENEINLLLKEMPCILRTTDHELRFTSSLGAGLKALGQAQNEIVGLTVSEYNRIYNTSLPLEMYQRAIIEQPSTKERIDAFAGRVFLDYIEPLRNSNERVQGTISVSLDVTELRRAHDMLDAKNRTISKLINEYVRAQEKEREWTALEIHDRIIQPMISILHQVESVDEKNSFCDDRNSIIEDIRFAIQESRTLIRALYPSTLTKFGLASLVKEELELLRGSSCVDYRLEIDFDPKMIQKENETTLYRVFHEALLNVQKHAQAKVVSVSIKQNDGYIKLTISDDGRGFDPEEARNRKSVGGLQSMHDRVEIIGGTFTLSSNPGSGTTIEATLPVSLNPSSHSVGKEV